MASKYFLISALAILAACGDEPGKFKLGGESYSKTPIVGGSTCDPEDFPETGLVTRLDGAVCTGTLITPDTVLTAAHCVVPVPHLSKAYVPPRMLAFAPDDGVLRTSEVIRARDYAVHPDYRTAELCTSPRSAEEQRACRQVWATCGETDGQVAYHQCIAELPRSVRSVIGAIGPGQANDIALLFLSEPISGASTVQLMPPGQTNDITRQRGVDIVGYGLNTALPTATIEGEDPVKRWGSTRISTVGNHEVLTAAAPSAHACHGDSGGPLMLQSSSTTRTQIGVASRIDDWRPDTGCASGLLYTRVDALLPWILETMAVACDDGARVSCEMPEVAGYKPADREAGQGCAITSAGLWVAIAVGLLLLKVRRQF